MSAAIVVFITAAIVVFVLIADLLCTYIEIQHIHIVIVVIGFYFICRFYICKRLRPADNPFSVSHTYKHVLIISVLIV